jgi:hypothetical protein
MYSWAPPSFPLFCFFFSRKTHYPRAPKNVQRHVLLLELREALGLLPADVTRQAIMAYDPLPPDNAPYVEMHPLDIHAFFRWGGQIARPNVLALPLAP